jgi:hypothetical protein
VDKPERALRGFQNTTREQRYVVSKFNQFIDKPSDDPLSAPVQLRGDTFCQWRYLGNPHVDTSG